jgi:hypothetical protein
VKYHKDSSDTSYEEAETGCDHRESMAIEHAEKTGKSFVFLGLSHDIIYLDYHLDYYFYMAIFYHRSTERHDLNR